MINKLPAKKQTPPQRKLEKYSTNPKNPNWNKNIQTQTPTIADKKPTDCENLNKYEVFKKTENRISSREAPSNFILFWLLCLVSACMFIQPVFFCTTISPDKSDLLIKLKD